MRRRGAAQSISDAFRLDTGGKLNEGGHALEMLQACGRQDERMSLDFESMYLPCQAMELDAMKNMTQASKHSSVALLPNHHLDPSGQLHGFVFRTNSHDKAATLPVPERLFDACCVFECTHGVSRRFNPAVLQMLNHPELYEQALAETCDRLVMTEREQAKLDCLPEAVDEEDMDRADLRKYVERRPWAETPPEHVGVYHAFAHSRARCMREHKVYVVVQGPLVFAAEERHGMWQDARGDISCKEFVQCMEVQWLRRAVVRNHGRVAARVAKALDLSLVLTKDFEHAGAEKPDMAVATTTTFRSDLELNLRENSVRYVDCGCLTRVSRNGVVFDTEEQDGLWLFMGPTDSSSCDAYGTPMRATRMGAMPTSTVRFHARYPPPRNQRNVREGCLVPDERFISHMEDLGFSRHDGVVHLMPMFTRTRTRGVYRPLRSALGSDGKAEQGGHGAGGEDAGQDGHVQGDDNAGDAGDDEAVVELGKEAVAPGHLPEQSPASEGREPGSDGQGDERAEDEVRARPAAEAEE